MAKNAKILILEDDTSFATFLELILTEKGYIVEKTEDPVEALKKLPDYKPSLVITDLKLPKMDGIEFLEKAKKLLPETEFIVITAYGTIDSAVKAMKRGASDYITKPLPSPEDFLRLIQNILSQKKEFQSFREETEELPPLEILFAGIEDVYEKVVKVAPTETTVILYGETGTGKTLIARAIHLLSRRRGNFVEVNCAALPETLIESELFGYEKGAFTGAVKTKPGKIELAKDGTLFLDEISEMNLTVQAKFLRVLQERTFERLGGLTSIKTNARIVAATNRDLLKLVKEGKFREDLYFRINVFPIEVPPLRDRKEVILKIANYLLEKLSRKLGKPPLSLSKRTIEYIKSYNWPGNIRELENVLERNFLMCEGDELEIKVEREEKPSLAVEGELGKVTSLKDLERNAIIEALKKAKGNKKEASKMLGISLRTLYYKIKEYHINLKNLD